MLANGSADFESIHGSSHGGERIGTNHPRSNALRLDVSEVSITRECLKTICKLVASKDDIGIQTLLWHMDVCGFEKHRALLRAIEQAVLATHSKRPARCRCDGISRKTEEEWRC